MENLLKPSWKHRKMKKQSFIKNLPERFTISNILNGLFAIAVVIVLINAPAKALLIRGLMKIGFFQPDITSSKQTYTSPDLSFENEKGQSFALSSLKGKVVFINFWATWCPPCIAEMPSINGLSEKLKGNHNVQFIMVDVDHDFQKSRPFMDNRQLNLPLYEATGAIPAGLFGEAIPTTVIIDKNGQVVFHHSGAADYGNPEMLDYINKLSR